MLKTLTFVAALAVAVTAAAQDKKVTAADFAGTWNIEAMSHQIALVIEPAEGNKVTATMMMMGRDMLLKGELVDRTLTLVGVKTRGQRHLRPARRRSRRDVPPAARRRPPSQSSSRCRKTARSPAR